MKKTLINLLCVRDNILIIHGEKESNHHTAELSQIVEITNSTIIVMVHDFYLVNFNKSQIDIDSNDTLFINYTY